MLAYYKDVSTWPYTNANGPTGNGNIDADPRFAGSGDYHLRYDSPCRGQGTLVLNLSASDFEWDSRGYGGKADIGADEFGNEPIRIVRWRDVSR